MILSRLFASRLCTLFIAIFQIGTSTVLAAKLSPEEEKKEVDKHVEESLRLMKVGEDDEALVEVNKALKLIQSAALYRRKAECLLNLGRGKEALVEAKNAAKLDPDNADVHSLLGSCFDTLRMDPEALNEFNIAIVKKPGDKGYRAWRSKYYERHHECDKAIVDLTVIIKNTEKRNQAKPLERRANCYIVLKDYPKAIADYTAAVACSYGRSDLLRQRAAAYDKLGNHEAAQKDLKAAGAMDEAFEPPSTLGANK